MRNPQALMGAAKQAHLTLGMASNVTYIQALAGTQPITVRAFVGDGEFSQAELEKVSEMQAFGGMFLDFTPDVKDTISYDGVTWRVQRYTKSEGTFTVYASRVKHVGMPRG